MDKEPLLLVGAGGHARSCIDVIEAEGRFRIVGLLGLASEVGQRQCGYEVIGKDASLAELSGQYPNALIAVGQVESPEIRKRLFAVARQAGFKLPVIVSPRAHVSRHATVGEGTILMPGVIINANARLGANCIINSQALVEHDAVVGDHCHISTGVLLNGNVSVGNDTFIGSGSVIKHGVAVGNGCVIGMASKIRHNIVDGTTVRGNG